MDAAHHNFRIFAAVQDRESAGLVAPVRPDDFKHHECSEQSGKGSTSIRAAILASEQHLLRPKSRASSLALAE